MRRAQTRRRLAAAASGTLALAAAALAAGCVFDWGFPADSSGDGGGIDAPSNDAGVEAAPPRDGSGGDAPTGRPCTKSADCSGAIKQYCHFADFMCGNGADTTGTCVNVPTGCANVAEVCACDGQTYPNECAALANGNDLDKKAGFCPFDAGTQFQCGAHICEENKEYCLLAPPPSGECKSTVTTGACSPISCNCPEILAMVGCTCSGAPGSITLKGCPP